MSAEPTAMGHRRGEHPNCPYLAVDFVLRKGLSLQFCNKCGWAAESTIKEGQRVQEEV